MTDPGNSASSFSSGSGSGSGHRMVPCGTSPVSAECPLPWLSRGPFKIYADSDNFILMNNTLHLWHPIKTKTPEDPHITISIVNKCIYSTTDEWSVTRCAIQKIGYFRKMPIYVHKAASECAFQHEKIKKTLVTRLMYLYIYHLYNERPI